MNQAIPNIIQIGLPDNFLPGINTIPISNATKNKIPADCKALLLLCELNQNEKGETIKRQDLYGIELAKKLRREGVNIPIIFTSFLTKNRVYNEKLERNIINTIGHGFIQLPFTQGALQKEIDTVSGTLSTISGKKRLNELEMEDIVQHYCGLAGMARSVLHSLSGLENSDLITTYPNAIFDKIGLTLMQVCALFKQDAAGCIAFFRKNYLPLTKETLREAVKYADKIGEDLISEFGGGEGDSNKSLAITKWGLLLLDDEITAQHPLVSELKSRGVNVVCTNNAVDANKILEEDTKKSSKIMVVVSDYRLEENVNGMTIHQPIQGYRFLQDLTSMDYSDNKEIPLKPFVQLVALSALPRKFLMNSFGKYGVRVKIFSKKDYFENEQGLKLLCDNLVEIGNEQAQAAVRLLSLFSEKWKIYEPFYRYHRNSDGYEQKEQEINTKAKAYCEGVKENKYIFDLEGYTAINLDAAKAKPENGKSYSIFINKMICRRVAIWYSQINNTNKVQDIYPIICGRKFIGNETLGNMKTPIYTNLALNFDNFPWNTTIEEKKWLVYDMGIKGMDELEKKESEAISKITEILLEWVNIPEVNNRIKLFESLKAMVSEDGELKLFNITSIKRFLFYSSNILVGDPKLVSSLRVVVEKLISLLSNNFISLNMSKLMNYLDEVNKKRLPLLGKKIEMKPLFIIKNQEFFIDVVIEEGKMKLAKKHSEEPLTEELTEVQKLAYPTNALLFYNDDTVNKSKLRTLKDWVNATIEYHIEQLKKFNPDYEEYDETKGRSQKRRRKNPGGDNEQEDEIIDSLE